MWEKGQNKRHEETKKGQRQVDLCEHIFLQVVHELFINSYTSDDRLESLSFNLSQKPQINPATRATGALLIWVDVKAPGEALISKEIVNCLHVAAVTVFDLAEFTNCKCDTGHVFAFFFFLRTR